MKHAASIKTLYRYPILPMLGEEVESLVVTKNGILGNQLYEYKQEEKQNISDHDDLHELKLFQPYEVRARTNGSWLIKIESPYGDRYTLDDDQLLAYLVGKYQRMFSLNELFKTRKQENRVHIISENELNIFNNEVEKVLFLAENQIHIVMSDLISDVIAPGDKISTKMVQMENEKKLTITRSKKTATILITKVIRTGYLQTNEKVNLN